MNCKTNFAREFCYWVFKTLVTRGIKTMVNYSNYFDGITIFPKLDVS